MPVAVTRLLIVKSDYSWICQINGLAVPSSCSSLTSVPDILTIDDFSVLLTFVANNSVCPGNGDSRFVEFCELKKGNLLSVTKTVVAFLDKSGPSVTVRHTSCHILVMNGKRCSVCTKYRSRLRSMVSSYEKCKKPLSKTSSICTPQQHLRRLSMRKQVKGIIAQNRRLKSQLKVVTEKTGVNTDSLLESDLMAAVDNNQSLIDSLSQNDFQRIFWQQQVSILHSL